jgi:hypothetical protein
MRSERDRVLQALFDGAGGDATDHGEGNVAVDRGHDRQADLLRGPSRTSPRFWASSMSRAVKRGIGMPVLVADREAGRRRRFAAPEKGPASLWRPDEGDNPWNSGERRELTVWEHLIAAGLARKA